MTSPRIGGWLVFVCRLQVVRLRFPPAAAEALEGALQPRAAGSRVHGADADRRLPRHVRYLRISSSSHNFCLFFQTQVQIKDIPTHMHDKQVWNTDLTQTPVVPEVWPLLLAILMPALLGP